MRAQFGGHVAVQPKLRSHIRSLITASHEPLCRRLLAWTLALVLASVAAALLLPSPPGLFTPITGTPLLLFAGCVSLTGAIYFATKFALKREWSNALSAAGFWAMTCGIGLQAIIDTKTQSAPGGVIDSAGWLVAAIVLDLAGRARGKANPVSRLVAIGQTVASGSLCVVVPLAAAKFILNSEGIAKMAGAPTVALFGEPLGLAVETLIAGALVKALISNYRRSREGIDRASIAICYFLASCVVSQTLRAASGGFGGLETVNEVVSVVPWIVLVLGFGVEMAVEQASVADQLQELETLQQVSWSVVGARTLEELLSLFAQTLRHKLDAGVVTIYLASDSQDTLRVAAACGPDGPLDNIGQQYPVISTDRRPGFHSGHTAKAFTSGEPQTARTVFVDAELVGWRTIGREDGCALSLPLTDSDGTIGVMAIYFSDHRQLTSSRTRLLTTLAQAATPAIRYAQYKQQSGPHQSHISNLDLAA